MFWNGKRVLMNGHTGFKGGWLTSDQIESYSRIVGSTKPAAAGAGN
jgi:CDP-glucose 4,6-dehydratase